MKKLALLACAIVLAMGLAACSGGSSASSGSSSSAAAASSSSVSVDSLATDDLVNPAEINPGWLDSDVRTSDVWYLDGDTSAEGIFFTKAANDAGLSVTRVDANDEEGESFFDLIVTDDLHLTSSDSDDSKIDIVFDDDMTCYDYVSGNFYIRGDLNELTSMLAGNSYAMENNDETVVTFNEDGTYEETVKGEAGTGTWKVVAATVVEVAHDKGNYDEQFRLVIDGDEVPQIMDSFWTNYDLVK